MENDLNQLRKRKLNQLNDWFHNGHIDFSELVSLLEIFYKEDEE